jgi:transposase
LLKGELDELRFGAPTSGPVFGVLFALRQIADELGISKALGKTRLAKLALFLVLSRVAHQGSRLSAVRFARDHAVSEVLGLAAFDEDDLYEALDELCEKQESVEKALWRTYLAKHDTPPTLFLYDVTSTYLEGEPNALAANGYNRDGKRGKMQIVIGLLTDHLGEPLAVRVFEGNTADPSTVATQITVLTQQYGITDVVFVGDRGMVKSAGKEALSAEGLRYISALTDPQIRKLLKEKTLQLELFSETVCEVEACGTRYVLRRNPDEAKRITHRYEDKLATFEDKLQKRNELLKKSPRCKPEVGLRALDAWLKRHKLSSVIGLSLAERKLVAKVDPEAQLRTMELAGCYVICTNVVREKLDTRQVHDRYLALQNVERDFRTMKTGLLAVRPVFVRKETRTRGHVFCCMLALKLCRAIEQRLTAVFGTTDDDPYAMTLPDVLAALGRLTLLNYAVNQETTVTRLPRPDERQEKILTALGVSLPA